jgi:hypothetical protein
MPLPHFRIYQRGCPELPRPLLYRMTTSWFTVRMKRSTEHVLKVLRRLRERKLQLDIDKCDFDTKEVEYLGLIIESMQTDIIKLKVILESEDDEEQKVSDKHVPIKTLVRIQDGKVVAVPVYFHTLI